MRHIPSMQSLLASFGRWALRPKVLVVLAILIGIGVSLYSCFKPDYSYGRITAHLLYKGQPVTMDWIVTCKSVARGGNMRGSVRTEIDPYYYGIPTPDGGMVVAVTPSYCGGMPAITNYLPVFMTGDKAGDFSFMTAYLAEEAYGNPVSKLSVLDVTMAPVTDAERRALLRSGAPNVVPYKNRSVEGQPVILGGGGGGVGGGVFEDRGDVVPSCVAFEHIPVTPELRPVVEAAHKADPDLYWISRDALDIAGKFYASFNDSVHPYHALSHGDYVLKLASQGYGAVRRPADAHASGGRVKVGAPDPQRSLLFDPKGFVITPIDVDVWHDKTVAQSIPKPDKQTTMPTLKIMGRVDAEAVGMAYCGRYPNPGFHYRFQNSYLLPGGITLATESNLIIHDTDAMYSIVKFYTDLERIAQ